MSESSAVDRDTKLLRSDNLSSTYNPPLTDKQKAIKIVRKNIKNLEQQIGVIPKLYADHLKQMIRELNEL